MAFQIDMSPLERSSMNVGRAIDNVGKQIGGIVQQQQQQQSSEDIDNLVRRAISGDAASLEELMVKSPQAAQMAAQYIQQQQAGAQAEQDAFKTKMARDTADFVERMHLAPKGQQEALFNAAIEDPRYDIDEEDRPYFMDENARKALIGSVKGKEYAESFFGKPKEATKYQQGTGEMSGYVFNPDNGTFNINPETKARLEDAKESGVLELKDKITLNKEFTNLTKDTKLIRNTAADLDKLAKIKSGPAALAMVFKFMKALDPTSVVREGEQASAENSAGVPEAVRNMYNKIVSGARLGEEQMKQFVFTAKELANSAIDSSTIEIADYLNTFEDDLGKSFSSKLMERIPKRFNIKSSSPEVNIAPENQQAYEWAKANPNDPRSVKILAKIGAK